jgi:hypothetical protein
MPVAEVPKAGVCNEVLARGYSSLPFGFLKHAIWPVQILWLGVTAIVGNLIRLATEADRAMLRPYERSLQPGLVGAGRIVPVAGLAGSRDTDPSSSA